jgi:hypothetical protein
MSEPTALSTNEVEVYIPLLNEGTDVLRPTTGIVLKPDVVRVVATRDYNPDLEEWAFLPGSAVKCVKELRGGREILVARQPAA